MAIRSIDSSGGVELIQARTAQAQRRSWRPPSSDVTTQAVPPAQEAERAQAEQERTPTDSGTQQIVQVNSSLRFHVDQDTGKTVAELVDHEGTVLRQMPTEEALQVAKAIGKYQGMFVDLKV